MKTILVTGADGQLGRKLKDLAPNYEHFRFLFTDICQLDITSQESVSNYFRINNIHVVINCAAYTNVDLAEDEKEKAYLVNEKAPAYLAEACKQYNSLFIHVSTDYVFDGSAKVAYSEKSVTSPVSVYGKSKLAGEDLLMKNNPYSIIIRTAWLYSEYGKNFAKTILKFAQERDSLNVVYDQIGSPTYAGTLASAILEIVNQSSENTMKDKFGIYHYSELGVCSWYDFATFLLKQKGIKTPINAVPSTEFKTKARRPSFSLLDKSKIIKSFDLKIPYWTDSCLKMLANYKLS